MDHHVFAPFDSDQAARASRQLINKSNQFNLTTRRYSEADVAAAEHDQDAFTLQIRLIDSFGDNGMISVVICRQQPDARHQWQIDTWLMSCRVLGRKVEQMVLRELLMNARDAGVDTLVGVYRPTEKNQLVQDHYQKLGFTLHATEADGSTVWTMPTATEIDAAPMKVERSVTALLPA